MLPRRVIALLLLTWVPLLVLSTAEGNAWGNGVALTFLQDIETHLRLLIAAPLLILAEVVAHRSLLPDRQAVRRQRRDPRRRTSAIRCRHCLGHAAAQFRRGRIAAGRLRVCGGNAAGLARSAGARRQQLVRNGRGKRIAPVQRRPMAGVREHARAPVPDAAVVLQVLRLGALPVAGHAHAVEPGTDASRTAPPACCSSRAAAALSASCCWRSARSSPA